VNHRTPSLMDLGASLGVVRSLLSRLRLGTLDVTWPNNAIERFEGEVPGPSAAVHIIDPHAAQRIIASGSIGFAEGYMHAEWDTPDLPGLLDLGLANLKAIDLRVPGILQPASKMLHRMRANTRRGSRRNIAYHYDLGNEFYNLWLDDTMTYSAALFAENEPSGDDLRAAQIRKWDNLLDMLQPGGRDHLLEIGCGWGGFAMHAAKTAGCRVTGVTLSEEQLAWARKRVAEEGLEGRVEVRLQDYRDIPDRFTGIVSIEMFEAVGEKWWPVFFGRLNELLQGRGRAAIQTITICDEAFEGYRARPDFIQRYIFPGGMLPSPERFAAAATGVGLKAEEPLFFGMSYARTLEHWLERFDAAEEQVRSLGFDDRFVRMWRYYLAYCRTGFLSGNIDVMQVALEP